MTTTPYEYQPLKCPLLAGSLGLSQQQFPKCPCIHDTCNHGHKILLCPWLRRIQGHLGKCCWQKQTIDVARVLMQKINPQAYSKWLIHFYIEAEYHDLGNNSFKMFWSTIWWRPDSFSTRKIFLAYKFFDGSNCTICVGKEDTFCWCFSLLKAFFRIVCAPLKSHAYLHLYWKFCAFNFLGLS